MSGIKEIANKNGCPNGHSVSGDMKYCPICGSKIYDTRGRFCTNCGNERNETDKFCPQCGMPFGYHPVEKEGGDSSFFGLIMINKQNNEEN